MFLQRLCGWFLLCICYNTNELTVTTLLSTSLYLLHFFMFLNLKILKRSFHYTSDNYMKTSCKTDEITESEKKAMWPVFAQIAGADGLPKTHKIFEYFPKFRPVIDTTNTTLLWYFKVSTKPSEYLSFFFFIWVFFHEHSRFTGQQWKGEGIYLTPLYHFHRFTDT